jgi:hypothetical protein
MRAPHAYVDESKRGPYLMCVCVVDPPDRDLVRKTLTGLLVGGQRRLHMKTESDQRKRLILSALSELQVQATVFACRTRPQYAAREQILRQGIWPMVVAQNVERLVIEPEDGQDLQDRKVLYELTRTAGIAERFTYVHESPNSQPMLWLPDAIAWAYGKGGDWRRRASGLVTESIEIKGP